MKLKKLQKNNNMYKSFTLLLVILCASLTINAQNSKDEYTKAIDFCACKIAYAYTNDYALKNPNSEEKKSFDKVLKNSLTKCDGLNIADLEKLLKDNKFKGFSVKLISIAQEAKTSYSENLTKEEAINIIDSSFLNPINTIDIKNVLSDDLKNKLQSFSENGNQIVEETLIDMTEEANEEEVKAAPEKKSNSPIPNWLLFSILVLLSIILFAINYFKIIKLKESVKRHREEIEILKEEINWFKQNNNRNTNNSQFENRIINDINELKSKIITLQSTKNSSSEPSIQNTSQTTNFSQPPQKETQKNLFAKTPISDKVFNAFDVTEDKEGKFYQFVVTGNNEAQFTFFNSENSAVRALNAPDSFLYRACQEIKPLNQNAKKIITTKPGIAIKQDDKWIVKEKAQITYE